MNDEFFDVLDEDGTQTGIIKKRSKVHRDGDWHRAIHIWIINKKGEILLQRRAADKDSDPNMLDISCAGHLTTGDDSITGALRELKEELSLNIQKEELTYITTLKRSPYHNNGFIDNEFDDIYLLTINKDIKDITYQQKEISEIMFITFPKFKEMINKRQKDLVMYDDEYAIILPIIEKTPIHFGNFSC